MRQSTGMRAPGFTLIELMIVTAIVAILASVAYPSYTEYVERARRKDATAVMMEAQQFAERYFTERRTYVGIGAALPTSLARSPHEGARIWYNIRADVEGINFYTFAAVPTWTPKRCGTLSINQLGVRAVTYPASATADDVSQCFNR
jgi:type IV pilus assembly protein PilE